MFPTLKPSKDLQDDYKQMQTRSHTSLVIEPLLLILRLISDYKLLLYIVSCIYLIWRGHYQVFHVILIKRISTFNVYLHSLQTLLRFKKKHIPNVIAVSNVWGKAPIQDTGTLSADTQQSVLKGNHSGWKSFTEVPCLQTSILHTLFIVYTLHHIYSTDDLGKGKRSLMMMIIFSNKIELNEEKNLVVFQSGSLSTPDF